MMFSIPMRDYASRSRLTLTAMNLFQMVYSILTFFQLASVLAIRLFVQFVACGVCAGQRKAKSQSKHWDFLLDDVEHPNVRLFVKKPTYTNGDELISNGAFDSHFLPSRILSRE